MSKVLVRAAALTFFPEVARGLGLDPSRLLLDVGLSPSVLKEPDAKVPALLVGRVLENAAGRSGVENFGLRMAQSRRLSNLGLVGLLIRDQPTAREAISTLIRHHTALNASLAIMLEEAHGVALIREELFLEAGRPMRQGTELAVGVMLQILRQFLGADWRPHRVCFMHPPARDPSLHVRLFGPCVEFNSDFNGIVLSMAELDTPNLNADPAMIPYAERLLDEAPEALEASVVDEVRSAALLLLPSGRCSIEQAAQHLGMVTRTVQRRLSEQGLSFSTVVNELRTELAQRYVAQSDRALSDVSALLGFAAPSGFSRWYQSQFGCSPSHARAVSRAPEAQDAH